VGSHQANPNTLNDSLRAPLLFPKTFLLVPNFKLRLRTRVACARAAPRLRSLTLTWLVRRNLRDAEAKVIAPEHRRTPDTVRRPAVPGVVVGHLDADCFYTARG